MLPDGHLKIVSRDSGLQHAEEMGAVTNIGHTGDASPASVVKVVGLQNSSSLPQHAPLPRYDGLCDCCSHCLAIFLSVSNVIILCLFDFFYGSCLSQISVCKSD